MLSSRVIIRGGMDRLVRGLINRATDLTKCKVVLIRGKGMALIREDLAVLLIREDQVVLIKGRTWHLTNGRTLALIKDIMVDLIRDPLAADSTSKREGLIKGKVVLIRDKTVDLTKGPVEETVLIRDKTVDLIKGLVEETVSIRDRVLLTRGLPMP